MRRFILWAFAFALPVLGASMAFSYPYGAIAMRTGAFAVKNKAAEPNCSIAGCHTPDTNGIPPGINDPSGRTRILGLPSHYVPGTKYLLRVHTEHNWVPMPPDPLRWGFQMQAVQASTGDSAGTWDLTVNVAPDSFKITKVTSPTSIYKNRRYLDSAGWPVDVDHPGGPTHMGATGPVEWRMTWLAPPGDSGTIYFFAASNSANGDGLCFQSGDFIFTTVESTKAMTTVDVPGEPLGSTTMRAPFPNPMNRVTNIDFTITKGGLVDLAIFDLQGRQVRSLVREYREAGTWNWSWDGRDTNGAFAKNGLYFIRLTSPGEASPQTRKITLAR